MTPIHPNSKKFITFLLYRYVINFNCKIFFYLLLRNLHINPVSFHLTSIGTLPKSNLFFYNFFARSLPVPTVENQ